MKKKSILIIGLGFYPVISPRSFRTTELSKALTAMGHDVTVITKRNNLAHDLFEKQYGLKIKDLGSVWLESYDGRKLSLIQKGILKLLYIIGFSNYFFFPHALYYLKVKKLLRNELQYDLIISIASPHSIHWGVASVLKDKKRATTWIADCGDPFMMNPFTKRAGFFRYFEQLFCRTADYITVPLKEAKNAYYTPFHDKIRVIPQGFNFSEDKAKLDEYKQNKIPTFAYSGVFYEKMRDPTNLLNYLISQSVDFRFVIYTSSIKMIQPFVERSGGRIILKSYVSRDELLKELSKMDFLVNINNKGGVQSPSKIIDYYITGRPILSINNDKIDPETINSFLHGDYTNQHLVKDVHMFDIKFVAESFLSLVNGVDKSK